MDWAREQQLKKAAAEEFAAKTQAQCGTIGGYAAMEPKRPSLQGSAWIASRSSAPRVQTVVFFLGLAIYLQWKEDRDNPCLAYGPERIAYYQQVGSIMMPVTEKPCIKRTHPE